MLYWYSRQKRYIYILVFNSIKRFESHSTQQSIIFLDYYQSYCDYLLKLSHLDEEKAVFERLTLSNFKKWSSTVLKTYIITP